MVVKKDLQNLCIIIKNIKIFKINIDNIHNIVYYYIKIKQNKEKRKNEKELQRLSVS